MTVQQRRQQRLRKAQAAMQEFTYMMTRVVPTMREFSRALTRLAETMRLRAGLPLGRVGVIRADEAYMRHMASGRRDGLWRWRR